MLRALITFCVRQPLLTVLGAIIVAAVGGFALTDRRVIAKVNVEIAPCGAESAHGTRDPIGLQSGRRQAKSGALTISQTAVR